MIADLVNAYANYMAVGVCTCLGLVACWNVYKELAGASH